MVRDLECDARSPSGGGRCSRDYEELPSRHHLGVLVTVAVSPVQGEVGGFEELFIGVLPRDVQLIKARFCELFDKHAVPGDHLFLGITRVENKGIVLRVKLSAISHVHKAWYLDRGRRTQFPPNIRRAVYMPTAATTLGLALKKR